MDLYPITHKLAHFFNRKPDGPDVVELLSTLKSEFTLPLKPQNPISAAVLIPLIQRDHQETVLLTQRSPHLKHHAGQISFPGGRLETGDTSLLDCALRETQEELGLSPNQISILGQLGQFPSYSGFEIAVFVGLVQTPFDLSLCEEEVAEAFEVPLPYLFQRSSYEKVEKSLNNNKISFYQIHYEDKRIWGFTAGMLYLLSSLLSISQP